MFISKSIRGVRVSPKGSTLRFYSTAVPKQAVVARYTKNGNPTDVIKVQTEDLAPVSPTGVLVKMLYAPINPADLNMVSGTYSFNPPVPAVGGSEGIAEVIAVGSQANKVKVGDVVIPVHQGLGTWRTHANWEEGDVVPVTSIDIKHEYLASLSVNPATALRLLSDFAALKPGDVIVQNGATSMVGQSVIQIAAAKGIKSINIIRRRTDYDQVVGTLKGLGATVVVADDFIRSGEFRNLIKTLPQPKLALNCVGGETTTEMIRLLAHGGTLVTYGGMSLKPVVIPTRSFIFNDLQCRGFWMSQWYEKHSVADRVELLKELSALVKSNKLQVRLEKLPFNNFENALNRAIDSAQRDKKIVLSF